LTTERPLTKVGAEISSGGTEEGGVGLVGEKRLESEEVILTVDTMHEASDEGE